MEAANVQVFFYQYDARAPRSIASHAARSFRGKVQPHPQLELQLDAEGKLLSSRADLALVVLDTALPVGFSPVPLENTGVTAQETLVTAGFGHEEATGGLDFRRLINRRKVAAALNEEGRFRFEWDGEPFFRGDSGGPCFRDSSQGPVLVGISTTGLGHEPTMTALLPHREWLLREIQRTHRTLEEGKRPVRSPRAPEPE